MDNKGIVAVENARKERILAQRGKTLVILADSVADNMMIGSDRNTDGEGDQRGKKVPYRTSEVR